MGWFQEFEYSLDERNRATIVRYDGDGKEVVFPSDIVTETERYPVIAIGERIFREQNRKIEACWLPDGITVISNHAFADTIIEHLYVRKETPCMTALEETQYVFTPLTFTLNKKELRLLLDEDERESAQFIPTIAKEIGDDFEYVVEDDTIASCSKRGTIIGKKSGTTTLCLCKSGYPQFCDRCEVTVEAPSIAIYPNHLCINLKFGKEKRIAVVVGPEECKYNKVVFTSSNEKVATVDPTGRIIGKNPGCTMITASTIIGRAIVTDACSLLCGKLDTKDVLQILSKESKDILITPDEVILSLDKAESYPLFMKERYLQKAKKQLTWEVCDETIASIDDDGVVSAKGVGMTYVKVEAGKRIGWCKVTVV